MAVMQVPAVSQWMEMDKMALGLGRVLPILAHVRLCQGVVDPCVIGVLCFVFGKGL